MIMKDARTGGAWAWQQDYGYWYQNGVLAPLLSSIFIAVDPATTENGCLQIIPGSHAIGRIDHVLTGDQAGADPVRVNAIPCNTSRCNPATPITSATHHWKKPLIEPF